MTKPCNKCGKDAEVIFMRIDGNQVEHIRCKPCDDAEFLANMTAIGRADQVAPIGGGIITTMNNYNTKRHD